MSKGNSIKKTPYERIEPHLKGLSNEEAQDVAVRILAQIFAKHVYVFNDGEQYFTSLMEKIAEASVHYTQRHSLELAMGRVLKNENNINQ